MRIARSTIRAVIAHRPEASHGPDEQEMTASRERHASLNIIRGQGCGDCCGHSWHNEDGSRIDCPLLVNPKFHDRLSAKQKQQAAECPVPALYAEVHDGKRGPVTVAEVHSLIPFLNFEGEGEIEAS